MMLTKILFLIFSKDEALFCVVTEIWNLKKLLAKIIILRSHIKP